MTPAVSKKQSVKKPSLPAPRYFEATGRRKTAIARVRLLKGHGGITVNERSISNYFPLERFRSVIMAPFEKLKLGEKFDISVHVAGGGIAAQADAIRHGISRALVVFDPELKKRLRHLGFLTRDPRMVERKKYGLKKARRAPQWAKR